MKSRFRQRVVVRGMLLVAAVAACGWGGVEKQAQSKGGAVVTREVRLRKLHLVRPDLIPYPICYEVCC